MKVRHTSGAIAETSEENAKRMVESGFFEYVEEPKKPRKPKAKKEQ